MSDYIININDMNKCLKSFKHYLTNMFFIENINIHHSMFVSGGCLYNFIHGENGDIDIFCCDDNIFNHLLDKYKNKDMFVAGYRVVAGYRNVKNVRNSFRYKQFNFILPTNFPNYWEHFDCRHACFRYDIKNDLLYINKEIYDLNVRGFLSLLNPEGLSKWRYNKLIKKGFKPNPNIEKILNLQTIPFP